VDIVVPVHQQRRLTKACLASILAADVGTSFELVVVDDASTDPALRVSLEEAASAGRLTLLNNEANFGFTRSVNRGMRLHSDRDVVLLNSDTVVFDGWLDCLRRAAHARPRVASVNPLTNASHIGCYPFRVPDGEVRFEMPDAELNAMAAEANAGRTAEVHTTVGFCMYIRRASLDEVGLFDAENFPVGYGEESDFCYRARRLGWRHLIAGDSFVRHWEGQTFGPRKAQLMETMIGVFARLHRAAPAPAPGRSRGGLRGSRRGVGRGGGAAHAPRPRGWNPRMACAAPRHPAKLAAPPCAA
jgi:GT2 family glycosyltransferase